MTTPYYQDDSVTIFHGDCRDFIKETVISSSAIVRLDLNLPIDAVLTDPPYGIDGGSGGDARDFAKGVYRASFDDTAGYIATVCVPVIAALRDCEIPMAVTPGVRNLFLYPTPTDMGCFWTPAGATHGPWGFQTFHPILFYGRDYRAGKGALPSGKLVTEAAEKNGHPCPKPLGAWRWLLDKVCPPGGVVFDPFVGSGTTLRAAKDLGRKAIGIEIEERYCEIAAQRCAQEVLALI